MQDNEITIESFLNNRENVWGKVISEENAAYLHAEEIAKDQKRIIQDQIRVLEEKEYEVERNLDKKETQRDMVVDWNQNEMNSHEAILKRRIAMASLKKVMPEKFESEREIFEDDIILYSSPLLAIIARFRTTGKPINKYSYEIKLEAHKKFSATIRKLLRPNLQNHWEYDYDIGIYSKDFKTEEDARKYHTKHSAKLISEYVEMAEEFNSEVQDAVDNFDEAFDFRLMREYKETENDVRSWNIGNYYNTANAEAHILRLKKFTLAWPDDAPERITTESEIEIKQEGFDFIIGGEFEDEYKFITNIAEYFDLTHLKDRVRALYEEKLRRDSEGYTKDTISMTDEEIMKRWYKKTPEDAQALRNRLISGESRVNAWGNQIETVE